MFCDNEMSSFLRVSFVLLMHWVPKCASEELMSRMTVIPPALYLTPGVNDTKDSVNITCQPPAGVSSVFLMSIRRRIAPTFKEQTLADADTSKNGAKVFLVAHIPGAVVSGNINARFISLILHQVTCLDEGRYFCKTTFFEKQNSPSSIERTREQRLTVKFTAGQMNLTASRAENYTWEEGELLKLTCSGSVGFMQENTKIAWVWEFQNPEESFWTVYNGDIQPGPAVDKPCYQEQSSVLLRNVTTEDSGRVFRCYVNRDGRVFWRLAAMYTVGNVSAEDDRE
ncbi:uncharacterized protein LOC143287779 [Babylonia areolata]|uniref:uncharacterized protein LOC143287779 n=1 Tax=Babylonia areolata TaxID=304850 RepID=UPI003FD1072B